MLSLVAVMVNCNRYTNNFVNNMALISRGYPSKLKPSDMLIVLFNELMEEYPEYKKIHSENKRKCTPHST